jgi:hypothetical protein
MELIAVLIPFFFLVWRPEDYCPLEETIWP